MGHHDSNSTISNAYATGAVVSGDIVVGGLVGSNMGNVTNSFWDTETTKQPSSDGGTGKITADMRQLAILTGAAGWGIDDTGGTGTVWRIYGGNTYPLLRSFLTALTVTVNDATKTYDGNAYSGGNGLTYAPSSYVSSKVLGTPGYAGSVINAGTYTMSASGLYSNQQGYDMLFVDGTLTIDSSPSAPAAAAGHSSQPSVVRRRAAAGHSSQPSGVRRAAAGHSPQPSIVRHAAAVGGREDCESEWRHGTAHTGAACGGMGDNNGAGSAGGGQCAGGFCAASGDGRIGPDSHDSPRRAAIA